MAACAPRAQLAAWGDFYVWPLPQGQLALGELDTAPEAVGYGDQPFTLVVRENLKGELELGAAGYADGTPVQA